MKKIIRIISLLLCAVMLTGLAACTKTPEMSVDEVLKSGYAMLAPAQNGAKKFTLTISQGDKHRYTFSGRIANGVIISSLTVSRNGLKSNRKDLFLLQNGNLYVDMDGVMSSAESEVGFVFTDSASLRGKYLTFDGGVAVINDMKGFLKDKVFTDWATVRTSTESVRGEYQYNLVYQGETATKLMSDMLTKATAVHDDVVAKVNDTVKTYSGDSFSVYEEAMLYLQDLVDIDTHKVTGEPVSLGAHIGQLITQELTTLQTQMKESGAYIAEGVSYATRRGEEFTHNIRFCGKDGKECGSITLQVTADEDAKIDTTAFQFLSCADFLAAFLQNVKNAKGVGYETSDFPYVATYTPTQLTLTESNDLYKCTHVFTFERDVLVDYVVTYYTYDLAMHNALRYKCEAMKMTAMDEESMGLAGGLHSGLLQYRSEGMSAKYDAKDPISLLEQLKELGVPTYGD